MFTKSNSMYILLMVITMMLSGCHKEPGSTTGPDPIAVDGEVLYTNGKIYTVESSKPWAEAMYVKDGVIEFIGTSADATDIAPEGVMTTDLNGAFVMPGIHDVHMHPLEAASDNFNFLVTEGITDPEEYADDVIAAIAANPGDGWLLGWGHEFEMVLEATRMPKAILDDVAPNRPVAIMEMTSHSIWANSAALELMGIDNSTPDPMGGIIMREANGEANGILVDNAGNLLIDLAIPNTAESRNNDYLGLLEFALPELAKHGITSVCDARTYWKRDHHITWKKIADEDNLTARVNLGLWIYPNDADADQISTIKSLYSFDTNSLLKVNQIKLYSDGIVHNTTSAMHDDYLIDFYEASTNNGLSYVTESRLASLIAALDPTGFDFHIHAIGNRGIHEALNAIEMSGSDNARHRITHTEYVNPADYSRFASLNVTADAQVAGDFSQPDHWHDFDFSVGTTVTQNVIPIKSLNDAGARVTLSSDWDVSTLNPFVGLQNAVTRSPQALSLEDAIAAYTINPAYVMRQEDIVGSLKAGKEADFIILDKNPFDISANQISTIKVMKTFLQGEQVFPY